MSLIRHLNDASLVGRRPSHVAFGIVDSWDAIGFNESFLAAMNFGFLCRARDFD